MFIPIVVRLISRLCWVNPLKPLGLSYQVGYCSYAPSYPTMSPFFQSKKTCTGSRENQRHDIRAKETQRGRASMNTYIFRFTFICHLFLDLYLNMYNYFYLPISLVFMWWFIILKVYPDGSGPENSGIKKRIWLVVSTPVKNISQWKGLSHTLWTIKNVPNHQPVVHGHFPHYGSIAGIRYASFPDTTSIVHWINLYVWCLNPILDA